jgi:indolepyruvate ferredoxin oxidoreductase alpha subunit
MLPSARLSQVVLGLGVHPDHVVELEAKRPNLAANVERLRKEIEYRGLSVVIFKRVCIEAFKKQRKKPAKAPSCEDIPEQGEAR